MNEMRPRTAEEIASIDRLLHAADTVLELAGIRWNDDPERYKSLKGTILSAAENYHADMREVER